MPLSITLKNETSQRLTYVETSPHDPQHVTIEKDGAPATLTITDDAPGKIRVVACTGFIDALMCSTGNYVVGNGAILSQLHVTNTESKAIVCIVASGGVIQEDDNIPSGKTGYIVIAATGYVKMITCWWSCPGGIRAYSDPYTWDGSSKSITFTATENENGVVTLAQS